MINVSFDCPLCNQPGNFNLTEPVESLQVKCGHCSEPFTLHIRPETLQLFDGTALVDDIPSNTQKPPKEPEWGEHPLFIVAFWVVVGLGVAWYNGYFQSTDGRNDKNAIAAEETSEEQNSDSKPKYDGVSNEELIARIEELKKRDASRLDTIKSKIKAIDEYREQVIELHDKIEKTETTVRKVVNRVNPPPPPKLKANLIIRSVRAARTKANGKKWDGGFGNGYPDLFVKITSDAYEYTTTDVGKKDSLSCSFGYNTMTVTEGDQIEIEVFDEDIGSHDLVGSYTKTIFADTIRRGTVYWSFDEVTSLEVEFER